MKFLKVFLAALLAVIVGSILSIFIWIMIISAATKSFGGETVTVEPNSVLVIDLAENITDAAPKNPFGSMSLSSLNPTGNLTLLNVLRALEAAKNDDNIKGINISLSGTGALSGANAEEIREAILDFKQSGKFVVAYDTNYSPLSYYLSSAADKIFIQPAGGMWWGGMASTVLFFKGGLDKLGVKAEIFRPTACRYKSAVEPFFLTKMSDANREQNLAMITDMWAVITSAVSQSRGISEADLNRMASNLEVLLPEDALKAHMVDAIIYEDQLKDVYEEYGVTDYKTVTLGEYCSQMTADFSNMSAPQVAVVYAEGEIFDGEGTDDNIYAKNMCSTLEKVIDDEDVKAVVFRVNSPGGSALASDEIWRVVERIKAKKPVIVSMGQYAASGGYYISCISDAIVADRLTLTGSIGVFGLFFEGSELLNSKLGITTDSVKTNDYSDVGTNVMGIMTKKLSPAERAAMIREVDQVYTTFTTKVAEGRNLDINKVLDIAGGRVWSGTRALGIGLADANGGLKAAISVAADKAGIADNFRVTEIAEDVTGFQAILQMFNAKVKSMIVGKEMTEMFREYTSLRRDFSRSGVQAYTPVRLQFE